jgi:hypothetical protein
MPGDSTWKQPIVRPEAARSPVAGSSGSSASRSTSTPRPRSDRSASWSTASVRCPRRSIFTSPIASMPSLSYWVTTSPFAERSSGT